MSKMWFSMVNAQPTVISLFAGCGGSSLGYQMAGYKELLAVEWNKAAVTTFRLNFPCVPVYEGDIHDLTTDECMRLAGGIRPGELDVLDGSPPCQGFSTAGKRKFDDSRNTLFEEYVRFLIALQPKAFIVENVTGLIKGMMKRIFLKMMTELRGAGYKAKAAVMNAMFFGVPQKRQRVIIIGIRNDIVILPSHPLPHMKAKTTREAIGDLPSYQNPAISHVWIDESPENRNTKTWHKAFLAKQGQKYAGHQKRDRWNHPASTLLKPATEAMNIMPYLRNSNCHPIQTRESPLGLQEDSGPSCISGLCYQQIQRQEYLDRKWL